MEPNEKRGRVKMQLSAAVEKLDDARAGLVKMGTSYRAVRVTVDVALQEVTVAQAALSAMREREVEAERKG